MINYNGQIYNHWKDTPFIDLAFSQLGAQFSVPVYMRQNKVLLLESTYFFIMSSLRRWRMQIPMHFTPEMLADQVFGLHPKNTSTNTFIYQLTCFRQTPISSDQPNSITGFMLEPYGEFLANNPSAKGFEVSLYRDHTIYPDDLSNLSTTEQQLRDLAQVYAFENGYADCFLLNHNKNLVEATQGAIYLWKDGELQTPEMESGCRYGVIRNAFLDWLRKEKNLSVVEKPIVPFELQKVQAVHILNPLKGFITVTRYRKKTYDDRSLSDYFAAFWASQA